MNLYMKQKIFSLNDKYDIYNENQEMVYNASGEVFALGNKIHLYNSIGEELIFIKQKLLRLMPAFEIYMGESLVATVSQEFTLFHKKINVDSQYGKLVINGDFWDHEYTITANGSVLVTVSKKWLAWGDVYSININTKKNQEFLVALVLVVDCILEGEENSAML